MARKRKDAGKQAMMNEAKALEAKGKKQTAKVPPDKAPELFPGRDFRGMKDGKKDPGPQGKYPAKKKHK